MAVVAIIPNALNVSYNSLSSTFSSRFPTNKFAPTSSCFLSEEAYRTRKRVSIEPQRKLGPERSQTVGEWQMLHDWDGDENLRRTLLTLMGFPHSLI